MNRSNGICFGHRKEPFKKFTLYSLYRFFVKFELDGISDKIVGKAQLNSGGNLDKYAGSIDVNKV